MMVMKSSLVGTLLLLLLLSCTVSGLGSVLSKSYSYIEMHYTWQEAQSYCRNTGGQNDLATFYTQSDSGDLYLKTYHVWIGMYKYNNDVPWFKNWAWSKGGFVDFYPWADNEPNDDERCGYVYYNNNNDEKAFSADCESYYFFICDKNNFNPESKTWREAEDSCREKNKHLADYDNLGDLNRNIQMKDFPVWIGLHREGETWKWSAGVSDYTNWASDESKTHGDCVAIFSKNKHMATQNCSDRFPFICSMDNLILVNESRTWEEALEYCRALSYKLVSVQPEDYDYMRRRVMEANTEEVWTGLRFLAGEWLWVNGADMMYSDLPLCPPMVQHCGTLSKNGTGSMEIRDCAERRNFLCYRM